MGFWWFMLGSDLLIPLIMIGFGKLFLSNPPKEINPVFGYRTSMSMKNNDTWIFAQKHCGQVWYKIGIILLPLSIFPFLFVLGTTKDQVAILGLIICAIQLVVLIASTIPTEKALRHNFDQNGNRK